MDLRNLILAVYRRRYAIGKYLRNLCIFCSKLTVFRSKIFWRRIVSSSDRYRHIVDNRSIYRYVPLCIPSYRNCSSSAFYLFKIDSASSLSNGNNGMACLSTALLAPLPNPVAPFRPQLVSWLEVGSKFVPFICWM